MTPRDARLLPRLLDVMKTATEERELGMAVLQVRRILKSEGLTLNDLLSGPRQQPAPAPPTDSISMYDDRYEVAVKLRGLAMLMRHAQTDDSKASGAIHRMRNAMLGGLRVSGDDVRMLLGCLRDLLHMKVEQAVAASPERGPVTGKSHAHSHRDDLNEAARGTYTREKAEDAAESTFNVNDPDFIERTLFGSSDIYSVLMQTLRAQEAAERRKKTG